MPSVRPLYVVIYVAIAVVFALCAVGLIALAVCELYPALDPTGDHALRARFSGVLQAIGISTIAVAALELSQTVYEEEICRASNLSSPTRARRFLSRFMVVIVVASAIEFLIAVFELLHSDPAKLPHAAAVGVASAVLLLAWGAFVRLNRAAEELEPEGLASAKQEDHKVE